MMRGATDVGQIVSGLEAHLLEVAEPVEIVSFNADLLLDYRARRPDVVFEKDRLVNYLPETLGLYLCRDSIGSEFLLLAGFEPDYRWERFVDAVILLCEELEVSVVTWVSALPMPVPHTRPIPMTLSGTREDFIREFSDWQPVTRLTASIGHLIEYRLTQLKKDVVGCALLLPHYLAVTISRVTGLIISSELIIERDAQFKEQLAEQIAENPEHAEMVRSLETRYDRFKEQAKEDRSDLTVFDDLPTADELGREAEIFLAHDASAEISESAARELNLPADAAGKPGGKRDSSESDKNVPENGVSQSANEASTEADHAEKDGNQDENGGDS